MKKNMGFSDRIIRVILAVIFAILYYTNVIPGTPGLLLMVLGIVFVLTSLFSFCPIYAIFGVRSCSREAES